MPLSEADRLQNYTFQNGSSDFPRIAVTPKQKRRIKHKAMKAFGDAPRSRRFQRDLSRERAAQARLERQRAAHSVAMETKELLKSKPVEYNECPTCGVAGPWSSNPCRTGGGNDAKKAHAGRVL